IRRQLRDRVPQHIVEARQILVELGLFTTGVSGGDRVVARSVHLSRDSAEVGIPVPPVRPLLICSNGIGIDLQQLDTDEEADGEGYKIENSKPEEEPRRARPGRAHAGTNSGGFFSGATGSSIIRPTQFGQM